MTFPRPVRALGRLRRKLDSAHDSVPPRTAIALEVDDGEAIAGYVRVLEEREATDDVERHLRSVRNVGGGRA